MTTMNYREPFVEVVVIEHSSGVIRRRLFVRRTHQNDAWFLVWERWIDNKIEALDVMKITERTATALIDVAAVLKVVN